MYEQARTGLRSLPLHGLGEIAFGTSSQTPTGAVRPYQHHHLSEPTPGTGTEGRGAQRPWRVPTSLPSAFVLEGLQRVLSAVRFE